jgi:hypothetical protein
MRKFHKAMLAALFAFSAAPLFAQDSHSLDLTVDGAGLSIGDSRRVTGIRLNYRDRRMEKVNGINATIWTPYEKARGGTLNGLALGLPATGARRISGIAAGIVGVGAENDIRGLAIGGIGVGAGDDIRGIALGGIGMGVGEDLRGLAVGGIGMGIGNDMRGIALGGIGMGIGGELEGIAIGGIGGGVGGNMVGLAAGGIGVGVGGSAKGVLIGGIGAGVGENMKGIAIGGVGVGVGGSMKGVSITGIGLGAGEDVTGIQVAGIGIGAGGTLKWVSIAGAGIGAPRIEGFAAAAAVGGEQVRGVVIAQNEGHEHQRVQQCAWYPAGTGNRVIQLRADARRTSGWHPQLRRKQVAWHATSPPRELRATPLTGPHALRDQKLFLEHESDKNRGSGRARHAAARPRTGPRPGAH